MMNLQSEEDERQERNEYGADWPIEEVTYLRSILHNEDQLINKNELQKVPCPKVPPLLRKKKRRNIMIPRLFLLDLTTMGELNSEQQKRSKQKS